MRKILAAGLIIALVAWTTPVQAGHAGSETISAGYSSGGSAGADNNGPYGLTVCPDALGVPVNCFGGDIYQTSHNQPGAGAEVDGFTKAIGTAADTGFGSSVTFALCLHRNDDGISCNNVNDMTLSSGCGLGGSVSIDTALHPTIPGFKGTWGAVFVAIAYVDSTTTSACFSSTGSINIVFSP